MTSRDNVFVGELSVESTWQQSKRMSSTKAQTDEMQREAVEVQTDVSSLKVSEQLDKNQGTDDTSQAIPSAHSDGMQWIYPGGHFDEGALAAFMKDVEIDLIAELTANSKSNAFDNYEPNWKEKQENVSLSVTLTPPFAAEQEWHACSLSWNCTGSSLAIAYGRLDTVTWCESKGYCCVWHVSRPDVQGDAPHVTLEADAYVHSVAFHPTMPSLLAAGTYNGEILIWDISEEAPRPMSSIMCTNAPREPVTKLQWLLNVRETREAYRYVLCSGSQDGKILFWSPQNQLKEVLAAYDVQNRKRNVVGVLSMGFVVAGGSTAIGNKGIPGVENLMIFGTETGEVFRTKPGAAVADANAKEKGARNSVLEIDHFETHSGPVHSIDCSPFFRNLFLTASSDGSVRLYSTLERTPLSSLEPSTESRHFIYASQWSPFRPAVIAMASRSSAVYIYDLEKSKTKPCITVEAGFEGAPVCSVAFNRGDSSVLASGDMRGSVKVWKLSTELAQPSDLERLAVRFNEGGAAKQAQTARDESSFVEEGEDQQETTNPLRQLFGFAL